MRSWNRVELEGVKGDGDKTKRYEQRWGWGSRHDEVRLNQWVTEERNLYEDYKKAFGLEPPMISGVAIMTDTDNTGDSATAFYGDIVFKKSTSQ